MAARLLYRAAALSAGVGSCVAYSSAARASSTPTVVPLASSVATSNVPTCVFVHGLDSSKETWSGVVAELLREGYPAVALDLRGHGESVLGDADDFSSLSLARDVLAFCSDLPTRGPCVLIGHSMGGKIAMRAAALDASDSEARNGESPRCFVSVIIEDMDVQVRAPSAPLQPPQQTAAALDAFVAPGGRRFASWEAAREALLPWYDNDGPRVDGWKGSRVRQLPDGAWWSDVNPKAQRLARDRVLATDDAASDWLALAQSPAAPRMHVWYADEGARGTVCALDGPGSLDEMKQTFPGASFRFFPSSGHSIHNTQRDAFVRALKNVVREAASDAGSVASGKMGRPRTARGG